MTVSASIDIRLIDKQTISIEEIVTTLIDFGWTAQRDCGICYSIHDAADDINFYCESIAINPLLAQLEVIRPTNKCISIDIYWQETEIGGPLDFHGNYTDTTCSLGLTSDRPRIPEDNFYGMTNFQWYLPKLLPPLHKKFGIEEFRCRHLR